jgi:hypothetical protein
MTGTEGHPTKTWFKTCTACHSSSRQRGKYKSDTRSVQQVEEVTSTEDHDGEGPHDIFGPTEYDETNGCYMVNVRRSEQEQVTTKVLNVLTDGRVRTKVSLTRESRYL